MYEVSAHRIQEVRILINNVLIVEEKLVGPKQLLLLHHQLVSVFVVLHDLGILHIVVRDGLPSKHYKSVFIDHVEPNEPDTPVDDCVKNNPRVPFDV